ncbi:secretion protein HlyD [Selenomonas dianae]|nr:secretion protein HlyD [Selenomonas dianae]WLD83576.1 secretion protein HlyD [Selenomonas dianae]
MFRPVKKINRKHSDDYAESLSTQRGRKRCDKMNG